MRLLQKRLCLLCLHYVFAFCIDRIEAVRFGLFHRIREMPLAEVSRLISGVPEGRSHAGERLGIELGARLVIVVSVLILSRIGLYPCLNGVVARVHRSAGWTAERVGSIGADELHSARSKAVEIWRVNKLAADPAAHGGQRLLVGGDEQDVRL